MPYGFVSEPIYAAAASSRFESSQNLPSPRLQAAQRMPRNLLLKWQWSTCGLTSLPNGFRQIAQALFCRAMMARYSSIDSLYNRFNSYDKTRSGCCCCHSRTRLVESSGCRLCHCRRLRREQSLHWLLCPSFSAARRWNSLNGFIVLQLEHCFICNQIEAGRPALAPTPGLILDLAAIVPDEVDRPRQRGQVSGLLNPIAERQNHGQNLSRTQEEARGFLRRLKVAVSTAPIL